MGFRGRGGLDTHWELLPLVILGSSDITKIPQNSEVKHATVCLRHSLKRMDSLAMVRYAFNPITQEADL